VDYLHGYFPNLSVRFTDVMPADAQLVHPMTALDLGLEAAWDPCDAYHFSQELCDAIHDCRVGMSGQNPTVNCSAYSTLVIDHELDRVREDLLMQAGEGIVHFIDAATTAVSCYPAWDGASDYPIFCM
jgi:hypothetical protein